MRKEKMFSGLLAGTMVLSSVAPAMAAEVTKHSAVIDPDIAGKLTIHKIIENQGLNKEADGLVTGDTRTAVNDIEFSYVKIADIVTISGVADTNGATAVGTYYKPNAKFDAFMTATGQTIAPVTINGQKYYTTEAIEKAMKAATTTKAELAVTAFADANSDGKIWTGEGGVNGEATAADLPLGLYVVAETDFSYHDGKAGHDAQSQGLHKDDAAYYGADVTKDGAKYTVASIDAHGATVTHEYAEGDFYHESQNPEYPMIETAAAPFLVSLPTSNTAEVDGNAPGTVWQYDVDVYPKNQTTQITKRIVDPDEADGNETLRISEDYQIGDRIEQVIWADAPILQPNYLNDLDSHKTDASGSVNGGPISSVGEPEDLGDLVADASEIIDSATYYIYNASTGMYVATAGTIAKADTVAIAEHRVYKNIDAQADKASVNERLTYIISDTMTESLTFDKVTKVAIIKRVIDPANAGEGNTDGTLYENYIAKNANELVSVADLVAGTDYKVLASVGTNDGESVVVNGKTHELGGNTFRVVLTEAGLKKLNDMTDPTGYENGDTPQDVQVAVYFDSTLNALAKIGETEENMNYGSLTWENTNTVEHTVNSNEVYDYTYQLNITKEGVQDARNVKFIVERKDSYTNAGFTNADKGQVPEKELSDATKDGDTAMQAVVPAVTFGLDLVDGDVWFVEEAPGIYHVWDHAYGITAKDAEDAPETTEINGVSFHTLTPAEDGTLIIKGLDADTYTFKEIATEDENNLLASTFDVSIVEKDRESEVYTDGRIIDIKDGAVDEAYALTGDTTTEDNKVGITIGVDDGAMVNKGIMSMIVNNYDAVDLRTGGSGRYMIYAAGVAMAGVLGVSYVVYKKREEEA